MQCCCSKPVGLSSVKPKRRNFRLFCPFGSWQNWVNSQNKESQMGLEWHDWEKFHFCDTKFSIQSIFYTVVYSMYTHWHLQMIASRTNREPVRNDSTSSRRVCLLSSLWTCGGGAIIHRNDGLDIHTGRNERIMGKGRRCKIDLWEESPTLALWFCIAQVQQLNRRTK